MIATNIEFGTIFKNTNPDYQSYFVFQRAIGRYSEGTVVENPKGYWELRSGSFRTEDLISMPQIYPIVGRYISNNRTIDNILKEIQN